DLRLGLLDWVRASLERCPPHLFVNQQPGRTRVAAPRLAHGAGIEEPARLGQVDLGSLRRDPAAERLVAPRERERDMAMADEHERRVREAEAEERRRLAQDVVPYRVDRAAVVELCPPARGRRLERAQECQRLWLDHAARPARGGGRIA